MRKLRVRISKVVDNEQGAVLVIFALMLVVFLVFAAAAVDLGAAFVGKRTAQNVVDVGALSGALETAKKASDLDNDFGGSAITEGTADGPMEAVEFKVRRSTLTNYGITDEEWNDCEDLGRDLAEYPQTAFRTPCISFSESLDQIRVRIPTTQVSTFFAPIIGINSIDVSAFAEVQLSNTQAGDVLPFGLENAAPPTVVCISDSPNAPEPCDGSDAGNFQRLDITHFGSGSHDTTTDCTGDNFVLKSNVAVGADHLLSTSGGLVDTTECNEGPNYAAQPQVIQAQTGTPPDILGDGLILGVTKGGTLYHDGRLEEILWPDPATTTTVSGHTVDNKPLWEFIPTGSPILNVPPSCQPVTWLAGSDDWDRDLWIVAGLDPLTDDPVVNEPNRSFEHMARCLREYTDGMWEETTPPTTPPTGSYIMPVPAYSGDLFTVDLIDGGAVNPVFDLQRSPRWGYAPTGLFGPGASVPFVITDFTPVYIQALAGKCNAGGCNWFWSAGETQQGVLGGSKVTAAIAFSIPKAALPQIVNDNAPGVLDTLDYILFR